MPELLAPHLERFLESLLSLELPVSLGPLSCLRIPASSPKPLAEQLAFELCRRTLVKDKKSQLRTHPPA
jgi:hypothetical protein